MFQQAFNWQGISRYFERALSISFIEQLLRFVNPKKLLALSLILLGLLAYQAQAQTLTVSSNTLTVNEGGNATFTFTLDSNPNGVYDIRIYGDDHVSVSIDTTQLSNGDYRIPSGEWNDTHTVTVSAAQDADSVSNKDRFSFGESGGVTSVNIYVLVIDDDDSTGPSVTSVSSGYYSNASASNVLNGPVPGGTDIYTKAVFGELVNHVASDTSTARPDIRYKIGSATAVQYHIISPTSTLGNGDCKPVDDGANEGATPVTTYICKYTTLNATNADFGLVVGTATTDLASNTPSSEYVHTNKINIDNTAPTVSSAVYYSDANLANSLTGTVKSGNDVYTKVTFSENVDLVTGDGDSARPEIDYKIGSGSSVQYDIVASSATLAHGDCKSNSSTATNVFVCRFSVGGSDSGTLGFEVGTNTEDIAGNALAASWNPTSTITLEPAPLFTTTISNQSWNKNHAITTLRLPTATGGDANTTITYTLSPTLPTGVTHDTLYRTISGTPTADFTSTTFTYTATETDGDSASLQFDIVVTTRFEVLIPREVRLNEGGSVTVTIKLSKQPSGSWTVYLNTSTIDSTLITRSGPPQQTISTSGWNTGVSYTFTAKEDSDSTIDIDEIRWDVWETSNSSNSDLLFTDLKIIDNDESTSPTVSSSAFYSNSAATTSLTGPIKGGDDIYTKVTFSENVNHVDSALLADLPDIGYKLGSGPTIKFDIVGSSAALNNGVCRPTASPPTTVYVCRYTARPDTNADFEFHVGTNTEDRAGNRLSSAYTQSTKLKIDNTIPTVTAFSVDGSTLTLTFSENMNTTSKPANSQYRLTTSLGSATSVSSYSISSNKATFTLLNAVAQGAVVTMSYTQPATNKLVDLAGNELAAFSSKSVTNDTDTTAPTVTFSQTASSTVSGKAELKLTFSEKVYSDTSGTEFTDSSAESIVTLKSGTATSPDISFDVDVDTDSSGNTVFEVEPIDTNSNKIDLSTGGVYWAISNAYYDAADNQGSAANITFTVDATAPTVSTAAVDGTTLTLTFSEALKTTSVPATSAFSITAPNTPTVSSVSITGSTATLTLSHHIPLKSRNAQNQLVDTDVKLSYTPPETGNVFEDPTENAVAQITDQAVTVNTAANAGTPTVAFTPANSAKITDETTNITLTFSEAVYSDQINTAFDATSAESMVNLKKTNASGDDIDFTASVTTTGTNANKVITINPDSDLDDGAIFVEVEASSFYDIDGVVGATANVTFTLDATHPDVSSAKVAGNRMLLTMSETLDSTSVPAASRFVVSVNTGTAPTVSSVTLDGKVVRLILSSSVTSTQSVTLAYTIPTGNNAAPLKDLFGNNVESFTGEAISNVTGTAPTVTFSPANNTAVASATTKVILTFSTKIYSDDQQTLFTTSDLSNLIDIKEDTSAGDAISFTGTIGTDSANTKTVITLTGGEIENGGFAKGFKYVAVSDDYFDADANKGTSANATFEIDTDAPAVSATPSGFFDDLATTTAVSATKKGSEDIYMRIVFNDVMKHVAGSGSTRRPVLKYWYEHNNSDGYLTADLAIVASTAALAHKQCQPMAAVTDYPAGTRYVCRYTVPSGEDGDIGFFVDDASEDDVGNTMTADFKSTKKAARDSVIPTVTSLNFYTDSDADTSLTGTQYTNDDIYTKVVFSEDMKHVANDGTSARPAIHYKIGTTVTQYDIVANSDTLASGDCKPDSSTETDEYLCLYKVGLPDIGTFSGEVHTATQDAAGNAIASKYTNNQTLTLEPKPVFASTWNGRALWKGYAFTHTLPIANGGDTGTTLTYTLTGTLPTGLSFNATTRKISGTPTANTAESSFTYTVTETDGDSSSMTFKISVYTLMELVVPDVIRIVEGSTATITVKLTKSPPSGVNFRTEVSQATLNLVTSSSPLHLNLNTSNWNTGVSWTLTASEDANALLDTDDIAIDSYDGSTNYTKDVVVRVVDNDDTTNPSVTAASSGYYSNAAATTVLTGPILEIDDIYSKITFSESVLHVADTDADARPEISYKIGTSAAVQYDIVANTAALNHGECRPTAAPPTTVYVCRYTSKDTDDGDFDFRVGTKTEDRAGRQLSPAYIHATKLKLDNGVPTFSSGKVNADTVTATFSEPLNATKKADVSQFTVMNGSDEIRVKSYTISAAIATFTLYRPVSSGATVTFAYTKPTGANDVTIQDLAGRDLESVTATTLTNETEGTVPTVTSVVATDITVTVTFSENMREASKPSVSVFEIDVANTTDDPSIYDYTLSTNKAVLKLATAVKTGESLTFTYNKPTGAKDTVLEDLAGNDLAQITNRAVTNSTTDLLVTNKSTMSINEGGDGSTSKFTVNLSRQPTKDVTVAVGVSGGVNATTDKGKLTFTEDNYGTTQEVTVTGTYDSNDWDNSGSIKLIASQGSLLEERLGSKTISLTVTDTASSDDMEVSPDLLRITEGSSGTFSVRLTSQPTDPVRVRIMRSESEDGLSVNPAMLVFTSGNYATSQTFTLRAEQDRDTVDEQFWIDIADDADDFYSSSHRVLITDTGSGRLIEVSPKVVLEVEEGNSAVATVKLSQQPTGNVTVTPTLGSTPTHGMTMSPSSLTFTTSDYQNGKNVTITSAQDANAVSERVALTLDASGGGYSNKTQRIEVVAKDDEIPTRDKEPTVTISALDSSDNAVTGDKNTVPPDGKIKITFSKLVGSCSLRTARVCPTDVEAWTTISNTLRDELFTLTRLGHLETNETRNVPFTAAISGATVTLTPTGLTESPYEDEPNRISVLVGDNFWSTDGGVQGRTYRETFEVKAKSNNPNSDSPSNQSIVALMGQDLTITNGSGLALGCLDVEDGSAADGQNVQTWNCNDSDAQTWRLEQRTQGVVSGRYRLISKLGDGSTYCLDNRGDFSNSARMGIWTCVDDSHGAAVNQSFDLTPYSNGWQMLFTRGSSSSVLWAERDLDSANGNVGQRVDGDGVRSEWVIELASESQQPIPVNPSLTVSVADTAVDEGAGAQLAFTVSLSRGVLSSDGTVSVDYSTRDGTATAGADYTASSGTVSFAVNEFFKTVNVTVLEDSHDDGGETMELVLSNANGMTIDDGTATGTINNSDPMPKAWLARFGRTVTDSVLDGIKARREASREQTDLLTVAGQSILAPEDPLDPSTSQMLRGINRNVGNTSQHTRGHRNSQPMARDSLLNDSTDEFQMNQNLSMLDAMLSTSFSFTGEKDKRGGSTAVWGSMSQSAFQGQQNVLSIDGVVNTGLIGVDYGRETWLAGVVISKSDANGGYTDQANTTNSLYSSLTAATLYGSSKPFARMEIWGATGYGQGELTLTPAKDVASHAKIEWTMAATGLKSELTSTGTGQGPTISLVSDAMWTRTASHDAHTGSLLAAQADVSRLRVGIQGSWATAFSDGNSISPVVEIGLRHDAGDAETGLGIDLGGSFGWTVPALGLSLELAGRTLVAHEDDQFEDWGISTGLTFDPNPAVAWGPILTVRHELGGNATGALDSLFTHQQSQFQTADLEQSRWTTEASWGVPIIQHRFVGSPFASVGLYQAGRDYAFGWRLEPKNLEENNERSLYKQRLQIEALRQEFDEAETDHGIRLEVFTSW